MSRSRLWFPLVLCLFAATLAAPALALARTRHSGPTVTATAGSGGTGIPSMPRSRRKRHHSRTTTHRRSPRSAGSTTTASNNDGVTAPVTRDGGSAHLGERTLRQGMHGHDVPCCRAT